MASVFPIVEGHGDVNAVPLLLRRIAFESIGLASFVCLQPFRLPRGKLIKPDELSRALALARIKLQAAAGPRLVLIVMDADDDCPVEVAQHLRRQHEAALAHTATSIVLAVREYESWFIAGSLCETHHRDLRAVTPHYPDPERIADAKLVFEREFMKEGRTYSETADQPKFTACLDLASAMRSASFSKLVRDLRTHLIN